MDARRLAYLIEIVDQGSISHAAGRLGISQPALTKSIRALEAELGVRLLDRSHAGIKPTSYGRSLYAHARAIAAEMDRAITEIRQLQGEDRRFLRIAVLPSVSGVLLSRAVARITGRDPQLVIQVTERQDHDLLPALHRREFDFVIAVGEGVEPGPDVRRSVLFQDRLRIIARTGHPLVGKAEVTCADLICYPWAHPVLDIAHRPAMRGLFKNSGLEPPLARVECGSIQFVKVVLANSDTLGLMPLHTIEPELRAETLCALPIVAEEMRRQICVYSLVDRPLTPSAKSLLKEIKAMQRSLLPSESPSRRAA